MWWVHLGWTNQFAFHWIRDIVDDVLLGDLELLR